MRKWVCGLLGLANKISKTVKPLDKVLIWARQMFTHRLQPK